MTKPHLIISNYDDLKNPYYGGGGALAVHEIAKRLIDRFRVTILTSKYPGCSDTVVDGVLYRRIGLAWGGPRFSQLVFQLSLPFQVMTHSFDLWLETFGPPFTAGFLPVFSRRPVIGLIHMLPALDMQRKYGLPYLPRFVEQIALRLYSRFIVLSAATHQEIASLNPHAAIKVIPNAVDMPARLPQLSPQHLLFMGRLEVNQKGLDLLLYAYNLLQPFNPPPLIIAGTGSPRDQQHLSELIARLDLSESVVLSGKVAGAVKDRLYRMALAVVVPSRFESFSLVALEALAYSKALVCFDISGLKWLPTFCAQKAPLLTPRSLADALQPVLADANFRRRLGRLGRSFAHRFNWDTAAIQYADFLQSVYAASQSYWSSSLTPTI